MLSEVTLRSSNDRIGRQPGSRSSYSRLEVVLGHELHDQILFIDHILPKIGHLSGHVVQSQSATCHVSKTLYKPFHFQLLIFFLMVLSSCVLIETIQTSMSCWMLSIASFKFILIGILLITMLIYLFLMILIFFFEILRKVEKYKNYQNQFKMCLFGHIGFVFFDILDRRPS